MIFAVPGAWRPAIVDKALFSDRGSIANVSVYVKRKSGASRDRPDMVSPDPPDGADRTNIFVKIEAEME